MNRDIVYLKNYTVVAKHGYYREEHEKAQRFVVSVIVECNTKDTKDVDDLKKTLNYEYIRENVYEILMKSPHNLIESLAEEIAQSILLHPLAELVEVDISKPDVWNDCVPGIIIKRFK